MARKLREEILPATDHYPETVVVRSARRAKTVSARLQDDGRLRLLVPAATTRAEVGEYLGKLAPGIMRQRSEKNRARRRFASDDYLVARAQFLREKYLPELTDVPESIRWVTNQTTRWGSATPSQGRIRISHQLQGAPEYALDFVLLHELCHFIELHHNARFRALENRYGRKAEAQAFLEGVIFAQQNIHPAQPKS